MSVLAPYQSYFTFRSRTRSQPSVEARFVFEAGGKALPGDLYIRGLQEHELLVSREAFFENYCLPQAGPAALALAITGAARRLHGETSVDYREHHSWSEYRTPYTEALKALDIQVDAVEVEVRVPQPMRLSAAAGYELPRSYPAWRITLTRQEAPQGVTW